MSKKLSSTSWLKAGNGGAFNVNAFWALSALFALVPLDYSIDFCSWWLVGYTWANWILCVRSIEEFIQSVLIVDLPSESFEKNTVES